MKTKAPFNLHPPAILTKTDMLSPLKRKGSLGLNEPCPRVGLDVIGAGMENEISFYLWLLSLGGIYRSSKGGIKG